LNRRFHSAAKAAPIAFAKQRNLGRREQAKLYFHRRQPGNTPRRFAVNRGSELLIFDFVINRKLAVPSRAVILIVT
jgi:hypothetical protein